MLFEKDGVIVDIVSEKYEGISWRGNEEQIEN